MSGTSNVGQSSVYEAGDQRNVPQSEIEQQKKDDRFHEGKEHSHKANDSSKCHHRRDFLGNANQYPEDERTIANKLERESKVSRIYRALNLAFQRSSLLTRN
jgi:hypothetical protein